MAYQDELERLIEILPLLSRDEKSLLRELLDAGADLAEQSRQLPLPFQADERVADPVEQSGEPKQGRYDRRNKLNDLMGNEWLYFTKTVLQTSYPSHMGHRLRRKHYANKPPELMREIVEFFTKRGQMVLDPFAGVGGTLLGAGLCGRQALGIELEEQWVDIYHQVCHQEGLEPQEVICGDCLEIMPRMARQGMQFDAIVTDPPYSPALEKTMCDGKYGWRNRESQFEAFSSSDQDFRNSESFDEFYDRMEQAGFWFFQLLRSGQYAVVMIRDSYQDGEYIPASFYLAERFRKVGFQFKGVKIWYQTGSPVRPYGYPYAYVPNIVHHNILVFRKPPE